MLYLPILVGCMACKYAKGWGGTKGVTPLEWTYLLLGMKLCQNWIWVVKVEIGGGRHPCETYFPTREYVYYEICLHAENTHLNSLDPNIQFTTEFREQQSCLPFLDILTSQGPDGILITMVYRKPTHTDQHLLWNSHHSITKKYGIYSTLSHRAQYVFSNQQLLKHEN